MEHSPIEPVITLPAPLALVIGAAEAPRALVEEIAGQLIDLLDRADGDPDIDTGNGEDEHLSGLHAINFEAGPGCPISDVGEHAYPEWQSRGRHKEPVSLQTLEGWNYHEDDEDADPKEDDGEDCCAAGDDDLSDWGRWRYGRTHGVDFITGPERDPGDTEDAEVAWVERTNQDRPQPARLPGRYCSSEDAEDDDPQGERSGGGGDEGEPDFRRLPKSMAGGAGCVISDPDYGIEDQNEGDPAELLGHP